MAVLKDVINLTLLPVEGATNSGLIASHIANEISTEVGKEFKIVSQSSISEIILVTKCHFRISSRCEIIGFFINKGFILVLGEYISELKVTQNDDSDDDSDSDSDEEDAKLWF